MRTITPKDARVTPPEATRVFKGIIYDVYHWPQKLFDGTTATFEILKRRDTVKVICIKDGKILVVEDEQPTHKMDLAVPGGRHDVESETELDCARREVREETGIAFKNWRLVGVTQPNDEVDWLVYVFLAWDVESRGEPHIDGGERITVRECTYDDILAITPGFPSIEYVQQLVRGAGSVEGLLSLPEYK
ncbi:MAG TPA: NUDIX domain-containing protein [Candidatus Saccharimonadales bacterium]|nr:NUDIX domain-containing protein [Candidatus Saccharimonadales bacterium]